MSAHSQNTMRVWCPDSTDEPEEPNASGDMLTAAEREAERRLLRGDYSNTYEVHVRNWRGILHVYDVAVESVPHFYARLRTVGES